MAAIPVEFKYVKPELPIALCKKPRKDGSCSLDPFSLVSMGGGGNENIIAFISQQNF
jgi:hypothetical protein